jgi:hypothetical protein
LFTFYINNENYGARLEASTYGTDGNVYMSAYDFNENGDYCYSGNWPPDSGPVQTCAIDPTTKFGAYMIFVNSNALAVSDFTVTADLTGGVPMTHADLVAANPYTESYSYTLGGDYSTTYAVTGVPYESTLYVDVTGVNGAENPLVEISSGVPSEYGWSDNAAGVNEHAEVKFTRGGSTETYIVTVSGTGNFEGDVDIGYTLDAQPEIFSGMQVPYYLAGIDGTKKEYKIYVPSGSNKLKISTIADSGWGTPDTRLYAKQGSPVGFDVTDDCYEPVDNVCTFEPPTGGGYYYIGIQEINDNQGLINLTGIVERGPLTDEVPVTNIDSSFQPDEMIYYYFDIPAYLGDAQLDFSTSSVGNLCENGGGDVVLYSQQVYDESMNKINDLPTGSNYYGMGGSEEGYSDRDITNMCDELITITNPDEGRWYIGLSTQNSNFDDVSLTANYTFFGPLTTVLNGQSGVQTASIADTNFEYFKFRRMLKI